MYIYICILITYACSTLWERGLITDSRTNQQTFCKLLVIIHTFYTILYPSGRNDEGDQATHVLLGMATQNPVNNPPVY